MNVDSASMMTRPAGVGQQGGGPPPEIKAMWESRREQSSGADTVDFSPEGELFSSVNNTEKSEMSDFRNSVMESMQNGTFDAEALAQEAPEALQAFADENDIDLASQLEQMAERFSQRGSSGGGRPQHGADLSAYTQSNKGFDTVSSLLDTLVVESDDE